MIHRHSLFPPFVVALTFGLAGSFFLSRTPVNAPVAAAPAPDAIVSAASYRTALEDVVSRFDQAYGPSENDAAKLDAVDQALEEVLALTVPGEERDLHLSIATALTQMSQGLRGEALEREKGEKAMEAAKASAAWGR